MRNKKLISMLMLSAGFVACTQDEIVENNYAGIENQKDLVEDVVLNVSLEEDPITRAAYAGGATEVGEDGERTAYEVYQNFYLEPAWNDANKTGYSVSNQEALVGDQIGFCLNLNGAAITNYPFYIAGYGSANEVTTANGQTTTTKKVYGLAAQSGLYDLSIPAGDFVETEAEGINASIDAVGKVLQGEDGKWGDLEPLALDVRKGIVRTNSGIMTGKYIAYFPYNSKFVDPKGIPAQGKEALKDIYTTELANSREEALQNVNFYSYLFANAREEVTVNGGTKAGDVKIVPQTSALTFAFTNSTKEDVKGIKRITVKAATEGDKPFVLTGSVSLDALNSVKAETTTDLIGAQFDATSIDPAKFDAEGKVTSQSYKYVTIPYMANETDGKYIIEIYNNNGEIAKIDWTPEIGLGLGKAKLVEINLGTKEFEKGTRKIFTVEDFKEEAPAGGTLELMKDLFGNDAVRNLALGTAEKPVDLTITGGKMLTLAGGTLHANIVMETGELYVQGATITGNIDGNAVSVTNNGVVNGNITATNYVKLDGVSQEAKYAVVAPDVNVANGTYNNITADVMYMTNATLDRTTKPVGNSTVTDKCVTAKKELAVNSGTINYAVADFVTVRGELNVDGHLEANTIETTYTQSYNYNGTPYYVGGKMTVKGTVKAGATLKIGSTGSSIVNWNTSQDMSLNVTNRGTLTIANTVEQMTGKIDNYGTLNLEGDIAGQSDGELNLEAGTLYVKDNFTLINFTANVKGGVLEIAKDAKMSGRVASLNVTGGEVIKVTNTGDFKTDLAKTTSTFAEKYTALKVNEAITANGANDARVERIYLEADGSITATGNNTYTLPNVYVRGDASLSSATASKAASITINANVTLKVTGKLNVTGNVVNNGIYDGVNATVNCNDFSGYGKWTSNVTPNC